MCDRPNDRASPSGHSSQTGKIFSEIFEIWVTQLSVRTAYDHHLDANQHGPKACASDQPSGLPSSRSGRTKPLYENYLQRTCDRPNDKTSLSGRSSQTGKIFSEIFEISITQLSVRTAYDHRPDANQHGPDACASDQPSGLPSSRSGRAKPLYGNYLQRTCDRSDAGLKQERSSAKFLKFSVTQLSERKAYDHRPDGAQFYQARRSFELSAYK
jgi:hypothetical protein